jgi:asparagine synthase (glutamine-hydrolysing)
MADASIIPTTLLSKFARESVTVALGGDGGDELFAGYPTFQAERAARFYQMIPKFLRHGISRGVHALPPSYSNFSLEYKLKKFLDGADVSDVSGRHMRWLGTFGDEVRSQLLSSSVREALANEDPYTFASRRFMESASTDERNKLLFMYQRTYMMDEVMVKVDRASMYASLEARAPFLAREVVELANQLPYRYKLHGLTTKYLLKELIRGRLPDMIIDRPKKGFGVPVGAWLRGPLRDWAEELLSEASLNQQNLFDMTVVTKLKNDHMEGRRDNRKELWNLIVFALWQRHWL